LELIQLRPNTDTTKWTIKLKDKTIKLKLSPCKCGVEAAWVYEVPARSMLPDFLKNMPIEMVNGDQMVERTLAEWHFHPRWWEKHILRHKLKPQLAKWIRITHKKLSEVEAVERNVDQLKEFVEIL